MLRQLLLEQVCQGVVEAVLLKVRPGDTGRVLLRGQVIDLADLRPVLTAGDRGWIADLHLGDRGEWLRRQGSWEQRRGYQQADGASQDGAFHDGVPPLHFVIFCSSRSRVRRARRRNSQGSNSRGR